MGEWLDNMIFAKGDEGQIDVPSRNGTHPQFTAGKALQALQVLSGSKLIDKVPYVFRKSGSGKGLMETDKLVGASVSWNQLVQNGNFATSSGWGANAGTFSVANNVGTISITGANGSIAGAAHTYPIGHKILMMASVRYSAASTKGRLRLYDNAASSVIMNLSPITLAADTWTDLAFIGVTNHSDASHSLSVQFYPNYNSASSGQTADMKNVMTVDLTAALNPIIADYIYGLETGTAGAGVAKLKEWGFFDKPYYAYNAGAIESVNVSKHRMTGLNQWDEEWELGSINASGEKTTASNCIRTKNNIPVIAGETYYLKSNNVTAYVHWYDNGGNHIIYNSVKDTTVVAPSNASYSLIQFGVGYGTTYKNDICFGFSGAQNGTYEPYTVHEYPLADITLRGILKLDGSNNLYADGDVYESSGKVTRKYGIIDLGSFDWSYSSTYKWFNPANVAYIPNIVATPNTDIANVITPKYVTTSRNVLANDLTVDKMCCVNASKHFIVRDLAYTDATTFKAAMNGVYLVYEITPTTETADPYNEVQVCSPYGTEEYVDAGVAAGTRDVRIPCGHETEYDQPVAMLPDAPSSNGNYKLRCTVSGGVPTYSWVSE